MPFGFFFFNFCKLILCSIREEGGLFKEIGTSRQVEASFEELPHLQTDAFISGVVTVSSLWHF